MDPWYQVTISGPGGCLTPILLTIKEALEAKGFDLVIQDAHPPEPRQLENYATTQSYKDRVKLIASHIPWGG